MPQSILAPLRQGQQFDIGLCMLTGRDSKNELHGIDFTIASHDNKKISLQAIASPNAILGQANEIKKFLKENYNERCIFLTGSGHNGHFTYYDIHNDIVHSGGTKALEAQASGITLIDYLGTKYNSKDQTQQVTLFFTNNTTDEIADIIASFG